MESDGWPSVGEQVYYRRIMTNSPNTFDLGVVLTRPPVGIKDLGHGVWEIETASGDLVTRKGYELRLILND